eukprot:comp24891_c0_seq1/m.46909 comp24891_c0_seq1/g.46909  ORF comp24891_c0_seq1/g.46909 comp24891_c0_seq1/m.46909 type:complete len:251 (-) comp24891_c0_seq1:437-1189(-)
MSWEDDDFEPVIPSKVKQIGFEDEDEDEDVRESWDVDSDEERKKKEEAKKAEAAKPKPAAAAEKKGKKLKQILKEKEKQEAPAPEVELDPISEKLRRQKLVEDADFEVAKATFGGAAPQEAQPEELIDVMGMEPKTRADFSLMSQVIGASLSDYDRSGHFLYMIEQILKDVCGPLNSEDTKKLATVMTVIQHDKAKATKGTKGPVKKAAPAAKKITKTGPSPVEDFSDVAVKATPGDKNRAAMYDDYDFM